MNSIDEDAELIGIDKKVWMEFRGMTSWKEERGTQYREKPLEREVPPKRLQPHPRFVQDDLPYFQQQDDKEAFERHKQAMAKRAFAWYRLSKKKDKSRLVDIYNKICLLKKERD